MKIANLLSIAATCDSDAAAVELGQTLETAFGKTAGFRGMPSTNADYNMEGVAPHVRVEFYLAISNAFIIAAIPEIRDGKFTLTVETNSMTDGKGFDSQDWRRIAAEDIFVSQGNDVATVAQMATRARRVVKEQHQVLLENAGLTRDRARRLANAF